MPTAKPVPDTPVVRTGQLDRYVGYYQPYATSHEELDRDLAIQQEVRNVAQAFLRSVRLARAGMPGRPGLDDPRPK